MADNNPIIDFGTAPRDLQLLIDRLKLADGIIVKISQDALTAGRNLSSIQLPSDLAQFTAQNQQLTAQIQAQASALSQLQTQYNSLVNQRRNSSQQTAEESVNQRLLNRNAMEAARINSTLAGAYGRLSAEQSRAARNLQDLVVRGRQATQTQRDYDRELRNAQREFTQLNERVLAADRAVGRFNRNVGNYPKMSGFKDLISAFGVLTGVNLFADLIKNGFSAAKELQSLDLALKAVTGSQEEYSNQLLFLTSIASKYGLEIRGLTEQFTSFYVAAKGKLAGEEIQEVFENISKSGSALGVSNETLKRSFTALNQMLSKGKVASEELRGQLAEALPGAVQAMTKAVQKLHPEIKNLTEKGLFEMIKNGKILAEEVLPETSRQLVILTGADKVQGVETLTKMTNRLTNTWTDMIRSINESDSSGFAVFVKKIVGGLTTIMEFTGLLFKDEKQLQEYFQKLGALKGMEEYQAIIANISTVSKEQQEVTKKALIERERETIKTNLAIIESEKKKRASILGGDRALFHLQTKAEEDALVQVGKSAAILKALSSERFKDNNKVSNSVIELTEDELKAKYEAAKKELELQALKQETILNGEYATYEEQNKALEKFLDLRIQIIKLDYNEQVRLAKGNADKIKSADLDMQMAMIKQAQDGFSKTKAIRKKQNDEYISEIKDVEDFLKKYHEDEELRIESQQEVEEKAAAASKKLIDDKIEKLKQLKQATKDYTDSFIDEFAGNMGMSETFDTFLKTFDDGTGKMTTKFKQLLEGADSPMKKFQVYFNSIAESAQEAFNFIEQASQKNFDAEKNRLQKQYDVAVGFAGDSAEAKKKLDEDLEKKHKEIANREAKAKKQQALFNIAIDTAQAVVSALPNFVLAGIVAAIGIAQAIAVNSQEIPQYWMGGTHDGGLMMVNDGTGSNYRETIVTPDGKIMQPTGRNVIMDAPAGTEIFTHDQWQNTLSDMLKGKGIEMHRPNSGGSGLSKSDMREVLMDTIGNQPQSLVNFDENGITQSFINKGNKTTAYTKRGNSTKLRFG